MPASEKVICHCSKCRSSHALTVRTVRGHLKKDYELFFTANDHEWAQKLHVEYIEKNEEALKNYQNSSRNLQVTHITEEEHPNLETLGVASGDSGTDQLSLRGNLDAQDNLLLDGEEDTRLGMEVDIAHESQDMILGMEQDSAVTESDSESSALDSSISSDSDSETQEEKNQDNSLQSESNTSSSSEDDGESDSRSESGHSDKMNIDEDENSSEGNRPFEFFVLEEKLLNKYTCPKSPPSEPLKKPQLTESEETSLSHYITWRTTNGTVKAYDGHAKLLQKKSGIDILSLHKVRKLAHKLTGLEPKEVDMCRNSCIAYTGKYAGDQTCPFIHSGSKKKVPCGAARYSNSTKKKAYAQYTILLIMPSIQALFANATTSSQLRYRDKCLQKALALFHEGSKKAFKFSDFPSACVHMYQHEALGLFTDPRDIAFALSTDGAQLTMKKQSNTWILILILLNLPPEIRYQSSNVIVSLATPGPESPGDIESFLYPLFQELMQASEGIWIWDAIDSSYFVHRAYIVMALGDMLGSAKLNGMAGHTAVYGDRFSNVRGARSSLQKGSKAQYYPLHPPENEIYNKDRIADYSQPEMIKLRNEDEYWTTLSRIEDAKTQTKKKAITKETGVSRLPLCAIGKAFIHPSFFPLDPFHLFYENDAALFWDIWIYSKLSDPVHMPPDIAQKLGQYVAEGVKTLPPRFCGPIRDPFLKRQSQYKVYEWMGLVHWYIVPICLELGFNNRIVANYAAFVEIINFAMAIQERNEKEVDELYAKILAFLLEFEQIYIGNNPENILRARLCIFQLIHIPIHIRWNGSIRIGSQATVERMIGHLGRKIKSKKAPFANLRNIIIELELARILKLYYPQLDIDAEPESQLNNSAPTWTLHSCIKKKPQIISFLDQAVDLYLKNKSFNPTHIVCDSIIYYGKLQVPNENTVRSRIIETTYSSGKQESSQRNYRWFSAKTADTPARGSLQLIYGEAIAFCAVDLSNGHTIRLAIYQPLEQIEQKLSALRGKWASENTWRVIDITSIVDAIGIWESPCSSWVYILHKHPGLEMLNLEERGLKPPKVDHDLDDSK